MSKKLPALRSGDTVGIVAPASPPPEPAVVEKLEAKLAALGYRTLRSRYLMERHGFLAGKDVHRASDIHRMFKNKQVKAILALRGGSGSGRLLNLIDFNLIKENPKALVGYSDITALHSGIHKKSGLTVIHGPMGADFTREDRPAFNLDHLLQVLRGERPADIDAQCYSNICIEKVRSGTAQGRLVGGNLAVLCSLLGTPYFPPLKDRILFLEDVSEAPYRIDRALNQLLNAGQLQKVAGIALGSFANCIDPLAEKALEYRQCPEDIFKDLLYPLKVPVLSGLPFGHSAENVTLPIGVRVRLNADKKRIEFLESAAG